MPARAKPGPQEPRAWPQPLAQTDQLPGQAQPFMSWGCHGDSDSPPAQFRPLHTAEVIKSEGRLRNCHEEPKGTGRPSVTWEPRDVEESKGHQVNTGSLKMTDCANAGSSLITKEPC